MSRTAGRVLTVVMALAGLAATLVACGDGDRDGDGEEAAEDVLTLEVEAVGDLRTGEAVTWRVTLVNAGPPVEVTFPTGQSADVRLLDGDTEVFRWSSDFFFTQAVRTERFPSGRTDFVLDGRSLDVEPGQYELSATLAGEPSATSAPRRVTVVA